MSLIPTNNTATNASNDVTPSSYSSSPPFTPFPQHFWDHFFSYNPWFQPLQPYFSSPFSSGHTVPFTELSLETSGDIRAKLECKEIPEAHIIAGELTGLDKDEVEVVAEDGGFVRISGGGGRFLWRFRLPENSKFHLMSWSMENGVVTVVIPKWDMDWMWGVDADSGESGGRRNNVRQIEITGVDDVE